MKKDTTHVGNVTEVVVTAALMKKGLRILQPVGDGCYYDLAIDEAGIFKKVQCKTGRLSGNGKTVEFRNVSVLRSGEHKRYGDSIDFYGVYCPQNDKVYFVPASDCAKTITFLRITESRHPKSRNAQQYEI